MAAQDRSPQIFAVNSVFVSLSLFATLLRIYCRGWVIKSFALDDWLGVIAQILFTAYCTSALVGAHFGTGRHVVDIPAPDIPRAIKSWWTCELTYVLSNMALKASICIFLLRICVHKYHKFLVLLVTGVTEVYSVLFFLLFVLQCRPTSLFWRQYSKNPPSGSCWNPTVVSKSFIAYSAISCWTDWTYSIVPMFIVWNLQMKGKIKLAAILVLATGAIASSATIVRLPYLHTLTDMGDFLYSTSDVAIWSTVETGLGITASGLATLRPLMRTFFGSTPSTTGDGTSGGSWQRTGSNNPKGSQSYSRNRPDAFEMPSNDEAPLGITTVINHGKYASEGDVESQKYRGDNTSEVSESVGGPDEWNSSQVNLAAKTPEPRTEQAWNITVKKSVTQTTQARK